MEEAAAWTVPPGRESVYEFVREHSVPRPYGLGQFLLKELSSPVSGIGWVVLFGLLIGGIATAQYWLLPFPILLIPFFGNTALNMRQVYRHGTFFVIRADEVVRGRGDLVLVSGTTKIDDQAVRVETIVGAAAKELIETHGAVEILALADPKKAHRRRALFIGLASRLVADGAEQAPGELPTARLID